MKVTVVVPVYNEEAGLAALFARLYPALDALGEPYEVVFVDDGSRDASVQCLRAQFDRRPDVTRVVMLAANFGQHTAIRAGFAHARGDVVVTLDADLQNPPEEIGKLLAKIREGHDYVGTYRALRKDTLFRRVASRWINRLRERTTNIRITDQGCMLRAYGRNVVEAIRGCRESSTFVPALAYLFARNPVEIEVAHEARHAGQTKYSWFRLLRLNFDLMTGFTTLPLQIFSVLGMLVAIGSVMVYVLVIVTRIFSRDSDAAWSSLWDRDLLEFFLIGVALFGIGLLGEYVGRIHDQVRARPLYLVAGVLEKQE